MKSKRSRRNHAHYRKPYAYREDLYSMVSPTCQDLGIPTDANEQDTDQENEYTYMDLQKIISASNEITNDQGYGGLANQLHQSNVDGQFGQYEVSVPEYSDGKISDPFSAACRIPLPDPFGGFHANDIANVRRRNERERERVRCVNDGYSELRKSLPFENKDKRISKVETLRGAIRYIQFLSDLLEGRVDADYDFQINAPDSTESGIETNENELTRNT